MALTQLSSRALARLVKVCGLVKRAFAGKESEFRMSPVDRVRLGYFRRRIGQADPRLVAAARLDLDTMEPVSRQMHARLGLVSFGRLLAVAEPHRARWAVQHLPYPVARWMRARVAGPMPARALATWESWILDAAWARLLSEGRLTGTGSGERRGWTR